MKVGEKFDELHAQGVDFGKGVVMTHKGNELVVVTQEGLVTIVGPFWTCTYNAAKPKPGPTKF